MLYKLSFLDASGVAEEVCKSDFEDDHTAILWMKFIGAERFLHSGWAIMELRCRNRRVARLTADVFSSYFPKTP